MHVKKNYHCKGQLRTQTISCRIELTMSSVSKQQFSSLFHILYIVFKVIKKLYLDLKKGACQSRSQ